MTTEDIPVLTLRVLERIQAELVGLRGDVHGVKGEIVEMKGEIVEVKGEIVEMKGELAEMKGELRLLGARFDHFLDFAGREVQDLKARMIIVETQLGIGRTR